MSRNYLHESQARLILKAVTISKSQTNLEEQSVNTNNLDIKPQDIYVRFWKQNFSRQMQISEGK